jgi:putative flippase GtrA
MSARRRLASIRTLLPHATRYAAAGTLVGATYIGLTLVFSGPVGVPIQLVIPLALAAAGTLHFVLQRTFVFRDREVFALSSGAQAWRYVVIAAVQYGATATATAVLPGLVGVSEQVAYVAAACVVSGTTFLFLRSRVFHVA